MNTRLYIKIAVRIILLFVVAMSATYIPEHLRGFFEDVPCSGEHCSSHGFGYDIGWSWGKRHYWYAVMTILLFILSVVDSMVYVTRLVDKYHPDKK